MVWPWEAPHKTSAASAVDIRRNCIALSLKIGDRNESTVTDQRPRTSAFAAERTQFRVATVLEPCESWLRFRPGSCSIQLALYGDQAELMKTEMLRGCDASAKRRPS